MDDLYSRGVGSVLNYSAEAEEDVANASAHQSSEVVHGGGGGVDGHVGPLARASTAGTDTARTKAKELEALRLREVERAIDGTGEFERAVEAKGGSRGSAGFALKIVSFRHGLHPESKLIEERADRLDRPDDTASRIDNSPPTAACRAPECGFWKGDCGRTIPWDGSLER